jgi:hypothetical protein
MISCSASVSPPAFFPLLFFPAFSVSNVFPFSCAWVRKEGGVLVDT